MYFSDYPHTFLIFVSSMHIILCDTYWPPISICSSAVFFFSSKSNAEREEKELIITLIIMIRKSFLITLNNACFTRLLVCVIIRLLCAQGLLNSNFPAGSFTFLIYIFAVVINYVNWIGIRKDVLFCSSHYSGSRDHGQVLHIQWMNQYTSRRQLAKFSTRGGNLIWLK